jgi:hypothetical protein
LQSRANIEVQVQQQKVAPSTSAALPEIVSGWNEGAGESDDDEEKRGAVCIESDDADEGSFLPSSLLLLPPLSLSSLLLLLLFHLIFPISHRPSG